MARAHDELCLMIRYTAPKPSASPDLGNDQRATALSLSAGCHYAAQEPALDFSCKIEDSVRQLEE